jgi:lactate dehydrogenase-like 2-hydroxyacid dehydrogenase
VSKPDILLVEDINSAVPLGPLLAGPYETHVLPEADDAARAAVLARAGGRVRALVTTTNMGAPGALIAALPKLEIISNCGGHLDRIDLAAARARGIPVTHTPGVSSADVADLAFGLILGAARRVNEADRYLRAGRWKTDGMMSFGTRVWGKTIGIVGLGSIGRIIAKRAEAFEMDISYCGPRRKPDVPYRYYEHVVSMAKAVDFLVVACPAGPATRQIVNAAVLDALGPKGWLVNIVRKACDDQALIRALKEKRIAGAGLDVYETEPHVPAELMALENVVLLPQIGSKTVETKRRTAELAVANLAAHFAGRPLISPVPEHGH